MKDLYFLRLFGFNYFPMLQQVAKAKFDLTSGNLLVIGLDTSKPTSATAFERFKMSKAGLQGYLSEDPLVVGV